MITISLCMIVKDEEDVLARCLDSVKEIADEIIIVDTGSKDNTKEIAKKYTNFVYDFKWIDNFAAARNFSFSKATMQYCLWLDADDVITKEDKKKFLKLKETLSFETDIVMMKYHTFFDEENKPVFSYYRERLIRKKSNFAWRGEIHEVICPAGQIVYSDIAITHKKMKSSDPNRNVRIFEKLIAQGKELDARQQFYYARELYYHNRFDEAIHMFYKFLSQKDAWIENKIDACKQLAYCYYRKGEKEKALKVLLKSFLYDSPRAEICCDIGEHFMDEQLWEQAIFWYKTASQIEKKESSGAFILNDCYDYIPFVQLCVCYDKLGDYKTANEYNEKAGLCKPNAKAYLLNKQYFQKKLASNEIH